MRVKWIQWIKASILFLLGLYASRFFGSFFFGIFGGGWAGASGDRTAETGVAFVLAIAAIPLTLPFSVKSKDLPSPNPHIFCWFIFGWIINITLLLFFNAQNFKPSFVISILLNVLNWYLFIRLGGWCRRVGLIFCNLGLAILFSSFNSYIINTWVHFPKAIYLTNSISFTVWGIASLFVARRVSKSWSNIWIESSYILQAVGFFVIVGYNKQFIPEIQSKIFLFAAIGVLIGVLFLSKALRPTKDFEVDVEFNSTLTGLTLALALPGILMGLIGIVGLIIGILGLVWFTRSQFLETPWRTFLQWHVVAWAILAGTIWIDGTRMMMFGLATKTSLYNLYDFFHAFEPFLPPMGGAENQWLAEQLKQPSFFNLHFFHGVVVAGALASVARERGRIYIVGSVTCFVFGSFALAWELGRWTALTSNSWNYGLLAFSGAMALSGTIQFWIGKMTQENPYRIPILITGLLCIWLGPLFLFLASHLPPIQHDHPLPKFFMILLICLNIFSILVATLISALKKRLPS